MNKLFSIMLRWLRHDKKRTALTLASITLSVFLIYFVGFYLNATVNALHAREMYTDPSHAEIFLKSLDQVKILDKNAAWETHSVKKQDEAIFIRSFAKNGSYKEGLVFPCVYINGKSALGDDTGLRYLRGEAVGGDCEKLAGMEALALKGKLPKAPHEIAVSSAVAHNFGDVGIGDEIMLRYELRRGRFFVAETEIVNELNEEPVRDDNGNYIYHEDTDGSRLAEIYQKAYRLGDADNELYGSDLYDFFCELYSKKESSRKKRVIDDFVIPPAYVELSDEVTESFEYTAVITGIADGGYFASESELFFSIDDTDILPWLCEKNIYSGDDDGVCYNVRVKKGIDAEEAVQRAAESLGLYSDDDPHYHMNINLLQLEGRQLEYIENLQGMMILTVIVMGLFMFLARLIINNAFEIGAAYRTEQYGALKTIGASDKQIFVMIMFECAMYMLIALPVGMGLALLIGGGLLSKIRAIGVFDPIFGEGVSESFFRFHLYPSVMALTFACALFSVFFSAYADAMRVRRMPPIRSAGYTTSSRRIKRHSPWLTRRFFGYPFGFAVKCISKQKVRFAVTLLAAVISGIFIMTLGGIAGEYSAGERERNKYIDFRHDINVIGFLIDDRAAPPEESVAKVKEYYDSLLKTGYFETIIPNMIAVVVNDGDPSVQAVLTDEFTQFSRNAREGDSRMNLYVYLVPRELYDNYIRTDISYDDLAASGKALICNTASRWLYREEDKPVQDLPVIKSYKDRDGNVMEILDMDIFNTDEIGTLDFTGKYPMKDGSDAQTLTESVDFAGTYTTDYPDLTASDGYLTAVMPLDSTGVGFQTAIEKGADPRLTRLYDIGFTLDVKEDMKAQASSYINNIFSGSDDIEIENYISQDTYEKNGIRALKIAGFGFGAALSVVVLMNIFSTMSANMINRRRDLSMMRSCGMSMRQVLRSLIIESSFYAGITAAVSSVCGWLISGMIILMFVRSQPVHEFSQLIKWSSFPWLGALALYAVIMTVMAAAYLPALLTMKQSTIADDIRTQL